MIISFKDDAAEKLSCGLRAKRYVAIERIARRKLRQLEVASVLDDLRVPPTNHLEALKGDLRGKHSIRINDQHRLVFRWTPAGAEEVEIIDYR
jgi:proteic killer suppression protein